MDPDLVHPRLRDTLRGLFVSYGTLRTIDDAFRSEGIEKSTIQDDPAYGERRTLVEAYYASLDFTSPVDANKFLRIFEYELSHLEQSGVGGAEESVARSRRDLNRYGLDYSSGQITPKFSGGKSVDAIAALAHALDLPHLKTHIRRIEDAVDLDPGLAIGASKEMVETVCKTILNALGETELPSTYPALVKQTQQQLKLLPTDIEDSAKGAEAIKKALSSFGQINESLNQLRSLYGSGHGKDGKFIGVQPRHARLAVGSAVTLSTFLVETYLEREGGNAGSN